MKIYEGAIFDLDGTLLDSMNVWRKIDVDFLGKRGFQVPRDYLEAITPLGTMAAADYTIRRFGLQEKPAEIIEEWLSMARDAYANTVPLKPFVKEYLGQIKRLGIPVAAATSSERELVIPALKRNGIYEYFDVIVTVSQVKRGKGFPDIYEKAAFELNRKPETCVVYEDIIEGIRGANQGGFFSVGVYDPESEFSREAIIREAALYIQGFEELMKQHKEKFVFYDEGPGQQP